MHAARWKRWLAGLTRSLAWGHGLVTVALCVLLLGFADRWWPATVLMFLPRGLWAAPLLLLVPAALVLRPRLLPLLACDLLLIAGPLTGFHVPWPSREEAPPAAVRLRLLSCNVHWSDLGGALRRLLEAEQPDVVALQGWAPQNFPATFGDGRKWHIRQDGEFLVASRYAVEAPRPAPPGAGFAQFAVLTPGGRVEVFDLHFYSPRDGLTAVAQDGWLGGGPIQTNMDRRRRQTANLRDRVAASAGPVLAAGDFNTPPESALRSEYWPPFRDAFEEVGWGWGATHFTKYESARIDHILLGPGWRCRSFRIGPDIYSPHRPLIADLEWAPR